MNIYVPDYYPLFHCKAGNCRHTCCIGWEIDIDDDSLSRFHAMPDVWKHVESAETPHIRLEAGERCPFLDDEGLCSMILKYGEDALCKICRDHPRFRNYWTTREEVGLGLVCEEAARLILTRETPMKLVLSEGSIGTEELPEDEQWLMELRNRLLNENKETGPLARLKEYLIYRHLADAMYDGRVEERIDFILRTFEKLKAEWETTDRTIDSLVECARMFSYNVEYDDEALEKALEEVSR